MTTLIVGASGGLGRALADECARRGHDLILVSRDERDLAALARHLTLVCQVRIDTVACDFGADQIQQLTARLADYQRLDGVLLPIGAALDDDDGTLDSGRTDALVRVNFLNQVNLLTSVWPLLLASPRPSVVGFGSIAAIRGRRRNIVYAAAKRGLQSYFESLRHLAVGTAVNVRFYQLGYLDTPQTYGKALRLPKASPQRLARRVLDQWDTNGDPVLYPAWWRVVAMALRHLPWKIYRRLEE